MYVMVILGIYLLQRSIKSGKGEASIYPGVAEIYRYGGRTSMEFSTMNDKRH